MTTPSESDHFNAAREFQAFYDDAMREVGVRIPSPVLGQTTNEYRRKTLAALQRALLPHNHELAHVDFHELKSDALKVIEPQTLEACAKERTNPRNVTPGQLKPIKVLDPYGRVQETNFIGSYVPQWDSQESFVKQLTRAGRRVLSFAVDGRVYDATKGSWR